MEPHILLAHLRSLLERKPDLEQYSPTSKDHMTWLAQGHALVSRWDNLEAISFKNASDFLNMSSATRQMNIGKILGIINRAIANLELQVPSEMKISFGAGDVYDFFKTLNEVIASAKKSLLIIDPYLDQTVFDHYLNSRNKDVQVKLLVNKNAEQLLPASKKYNAQFGDVLEIKKSKTLHDRVIFVDGYVCWLIGQSLKDAAKAKPTYIAPLPPDVVPAKLKNYEEIWSGANVL